MPCNTTEERQQIRNISTDGLRFSVGSNDPCVDGDDKLNIDEFGVNDFNGSLELGVNINNTPIIASIPLLTPIASDNLKAVLWNESLKKYVFGSGSADFNDGGDAATAPRSLGNTTVQPLQFITSNVNRIQIDADGKIGINQPSPGYQFDIKYSSGTGIFQLRDFNSVSVLNVTTGGTMNIFKTVANSLPLVFADTNQNVAAITLLRNQNAGANARAVVVAQSNGGEISMEHNTPASTIPNIVRTGLIKGSSNSEGIVLWASKGDNAGRIKFIIGDDSADDKVFGDWTQAGLKVGSKGNALGTLHVDQSNTVGAKPSLYLQQQDEDQPLIEIEGVVGVGKTIEAVGVKTFTPTHFAMVKLPGGLIRYEQYGTIA